jgi:hypothetical protein
MQENMRLKSRNQELEGDVQRLKADNDLRIQEIQQLTRESD